jgi:hypothetical protein
MEAFSPRAVGAAYSAVAHQYAEVFGDDLGQLPIDLAALDAFVAEVGQGGAECSISAAVLDRWADI